MNISNINPFKPGDLVRIYHKGSTILKEHLFVWNATREQFTNVATGSLALIIEIDDKGTTPTYLMGRTYYMSTILIGAEMYMISTEFLKPLEGPRVSQND